ncbi:MAG: OsmC family protein [Bacteroidales bacterium]|nr:OsmC family protein [Bacteroidales bacterium]MBN2750904.1 OsmC family protein [Bacteroidales bacterium]
MSKITLQTDWKEGMRFETEINGHKLIIDAGEDNGGTNQGPRPKQLMLAALAGCTGMDVVGILKKMRVDFTDFSIEIEANQTEEHPKHYDAMKVIYKFKGNNLDMEKLQKAVSLSEERYCGVSAVYKKAMPVTFEVRIE